MCLGVCLVLTSKQTVFSQLNSGRFAFAKWTEHNISTAAKKSVKKKYTDVIAIAFIPSHQVSSLGHR